jgi:hypothetical protein
MERRYCTAFKREALIKGGRGLFIYRKEEQQFSAGKKTA